MNEVHRDPNDPSQEITHIRREFNGDDMLVVSAITVINIFSVLLSVYIYVFILSLVFMCFIL